MKIKYLIGGGVLLIFAIVAVLSFNSNKIEYSNFADAKTSGKVVQIIGSWNKDLPANYDTKTSCFTFTMKDKMMQFQKLYLMVENQIISI